MLQRLSLPATALSRIPRRVDPWLLLLLGLSLLALTPLASPGYFFSAHDGRHSIFYVEMFHQSIRDGALWPVWAMHHNQGYGYPTFLVQAPLAFYVAELFVLLGFGIVTAVKLAWVVGFLASAWGMYALVRAWLGPGVAGRAGGLVAGLLYVFIPYHLLDIYVRAAFAETLLMAWFPWTFLAFERLLAQGSRPGWAGRLLLAALNFAGLLLTHVFALIAFTPLLVAFVLFRLGQNAWATRRETKGGLWGAVGRLFWPGGAGRRGEGLLALAAGGAGLLLTSIFLLPLLAEGPLLDQEVFLQESYDYSRNWVFFGQFFSPFWGYGFSDDPAGVNDGMGFQVGLVPVLLLAVGLVSAVAPGNRRRGVQIFLLLMTGAVLFFTTPGSGFVWRAVPAVAVIQFPWRLLALSSFTASALGGVVLVGLLPRPWPGSSAEAGPLVIGLLVIVASFGYARPERLEPVAPWRTDGRAVAQFEEQHPDMIGYTRQVEERFRTSGLTAAYRNYAGEFALDALPRLQILQGDGRVTDVYSRGSSFGGQVAMDSPGVVQVRLYDFPGWRVRLNGEPVPHRTSPPRGLIELDVPAGSHRIDVRMGLTPSRRTGRLLTLGTLLLLLGLWGWQRSQRPA